MYTERFTEPHATGLERLTGGNRGLFYTNERTEQVEESVDDGSAIVKTLYAYDVYEIEDARSHAKTKNSVITDEHPFGDETKILRKALAYLTERLALTDDPALAEFRAYHDFCESV